ncbi:hypothetical protein NADFUDRAFT_51410 [Nadsonia fulvescens var. elongata DSM 6958]|uniref:Actin-crosslinking protein n=1 Tax=Nadsonia fulvescens var. elongata DSM 6958 TaxID=857566 RepID=A0A1E3PL38_9ASCO|nr:hypothetical protein NADFUDRAFT_51410 [Nadsonia fulvescens var. elongata DSM 6958]
MVSKLTFKGDKPKKRKSKLVIASESECGSSIPSSSSNAKRPKSDSKATSDAIEGWSSALSSADLNGPCLISFLVDSKPYCLATSGEGDAVVSSNLDILLDDLETATDGAIIDSIEPNQVNQVFVFVPLKFHEQSKPLLNNDHRPELIDQTRPDDNTPFALKSSRGKYVAVDKYGAVTINSTAIGPAETLRFRQVQKSQRWHIETVWDKYFQFNERKLGGENENQISLAIRADSTDTGFCEEFNIRIQTKNKTKDSTVVKSLDYNRISSRELEKLAARPLTDDEIRLLKRANREGKLNEALLDIRQGSKTDRRCY